VGSPRRPGKGRELRGLVRSYLTLTSSRDALMRLHDLLDDSEG
jgi:hypothetical protein